MAKARPVKQRSGYTFLLARVDDDLTTEELNLSPKLTQAIETCLRVGLRNAPEKMKPKLRQCLRFLQCVSIEEIGGQESGVADDIDR